MAEDLRQRTLELTPRATADGAALLSPGAPADANTRRLARLDRPIGIWLLLWPVLWALWIAGAGRPAPRVLIVFVLGVFAMRAAGCVINDLVDRNIDPRIRRTRQRPLAARRVTPHEALVLFVLLSAAALWLVLQLNALTFRLSLVGAALTVSYPFVKRFFPLPQLYLGISFGGWGVPMAFAAQTGQVPRIAWVIFMAAVVWAVIYDTLYAMVDREDDLKIGVRSTAIAFADMDRAMIGILQLLMLAALALVGPHPAFRQLVLRRPGCRRRDLRVPAMADPRPRPGCLPARLPQQQLHRRRDLRRHPAAVPLRRGS